MSNKTKRILIIILVLLFLILFNGYFFVNWYAKKSFSPEKIYWGLTFSKPYSEYLGLDWKKSYLQILDDLQIRVLRLPAYWTEIEPIQDNFNFKDLDWQIEQAAKRDIKITLAIGRKLPRWPECWAPEWTEKMSEGEIQERIIIMLRKVVERYKNNPAIMYWQVENEPLVGWFGECHLPNEFFLREEVGLVRSIDTRPVIITDSGELSWWHNTSELADVLGVTMYRVVWSKFFYFHWPLTPSFYQLKALMAGVKDRVINTELQAEPWPSKRGILETPLEEQFKSMNLRQLEKNLEFARITGFPQVYVWGVEWWYWLEEAHNESGFVDFMKDFFKNEYNREYRYDVKAVGI